MRLTSLRLAVSALLALLSAPVAAAPDALDATLEPVRAEHQLPALAAAVVKGGEIVAAGAVGERALGSGIAVTIDDRFHLGSDTKAMTATLAAMLVEEGRLRWSSTVGETIGAAFPGMVPELAAVTLEQLLSHSSGIPGDTAEMMNLYFNVDAFDHGPSARRLRVIDAWKTKVPVKPAGSPFQYSNLGYLIAGTMIEAASGHPWERLIRDRLFDPLGLATAGLGSTVTLGRLDAAAAHMRGPDGSVTVRAWGIAADAPPMLGPTGGAHMSVLDFARWAGWNAGEGRRGPALLKPESFRTLHAVHTRTPPRPNAPPGTPDAGGYGLGWGVVAFPWSDRPLLAHNGSNGMNLAKILVDTERDLAVVVLTNIGGKAADDGASAVQQALYERYR
ncbi:methylmalonyl-CoA mutase [alpha proteobacterium BAL199]|nr:methylmalonyl-CoA mutase [alpha proteobacterium BAL199]